MQHHNRQKSSTFSRDKEVRKIYTFTIPRENFDELNPDKQVIRQLISKHISMVGRLQKNMRYYGGDHEILKEKRKNKLVCNHAKDISDTASSYFIGNPVTYKSEAVITPLTDALQTAEADETDGDNGLELSIYGIAYEYIYVKENENYLVTKNISAENTFVVKDDSIEENELFAVYYYIRKDDSGMRPDHYRATVVTPNYKYELDIENSNTYQPTTEQAVPHYLSEIPIIEYLNNKLAIGDFELQIPLIDAYNALMSGIADRVFETIGAAFGGFAAFIGGIFKNAVADARKYIIKHFTEAGKFTWEGFKNGVVQSFKDIGTWIKAHIFKPFINGFKKAFGIHSPSTVMRTQGGYVISGLFNGMKAGLPAVLSWIAKLPGQTKEKLGNAKTWLRGKGNAAITGLKNGWEAVRESTFLSRVKKIGSQSFNAIGDIKSKVTPKGRDIISGMRTGLNNNWSSLSGILSNIPGKVANAIPSLYTVGQNVIQTFANGFSSIHIPMPHINWDWEGGSIKIGNFKFSLPRFNLSWYANGGFPGMGEMFVARESGPELVGRMGNRSAVANNNQIIAGIRAGVFEAVVNAFESMQGRNDRGQELHIYLEGDAKKLFKVIRQEGNNYQKQTGNPVFG